MKTYVSNTSDAGALELATVQLFDSGAEISGRLELNETSKSCQLWVGENREEERTPPH